MKAPIYIFAIFFSSIAVAQPKLADKIVAIIDDRYISLSEVENQYQQYTYQSTAPIPADLKCQILDNFMIEKLMVRQAILDSVVVTDQEVEQSLDSRIKTYSGMAGGLAKLEEYYGKSILEIKDEFREPIRDNLLSNGERQTIVKDIKVTPSDVINYFNTLPKDSLPYFNSEIELGELIIYPKVNDQVREYSKQRIQELLQRVKNGENFASLASAYSDDPGSAENGGELGFVNRGELDENFEAAAYGLKKPNDISDVVESAFGFHIIQLIERRGDKINVRHILIKPKITSYDISKAGKLADSTYDLIQSGRYSFSLAVNKFSEDEDSKNNGGMLQNPNNGSNQFEASDLGTFDQSLVPATDTLQVGAITRPIVFRTKRDETGFRIIYLKSRTKPHQANLKDDYDKIQQMALQEKQLVAITNWINERIEKSYIFVAPEYQDCRVINKWINKEQ